MNNPPSFWWQQSLCDVPTPASSPREQDKRKQPQVVQGVEYWENSSLTGLSSSGTVAQGRGKSPSLGGFNSPVDVALGDMVSGSLVSAWGMAGPHRLRGTFQPKRFCDSQTDSCLVYPTAWEEELYMRKAPKAQPRGEQRILWIKRTSEP